MFELIAVWGFLGGLLRALLGFFSRGRPDWKGVAIALAITGFVGLMSACAVFFFDITLFYTMSWKVAFAAVLTGYVGVDLLNSMFIILREKKIEI